MKMKDFAAQVSAAALAGKTPPPADKFDFEKVPFGIASGNNKFGSTICPTCGKPPTKMEGSFANLPDSFLFRNTGSAREYEISGMCQACQDSVFGED